MSYCRNDGIESDVYVIRSGNGLACLHNTRNSLYGATEQEMIDHLIGHRRQGHKVPRRALNRLEAERDGREWTTDVQLALEAIGIETRHDLIVSPVTGEKIELDTGPRGQ